MFWFLSSVWAINWNEQIAIALMDEVRFRVESIIDRPVDVDIEELGLKTDSPCATLDRVDINFPEREDFQGLISVRAFLFSKGSLCQSLRFQSRVRIIATLPVSQRSVPALGDVSVIEAKVRYDTVQGTPISMESGPWVARTNLKKMEPITRERVKLKPLNHEGDQVIVLLKKNSLEIQTKGKLMSDAYKKSRVRVLVFATSTVLDGILVEKNRVEIIGDKP